MAFDNSNERLLPDNTVQGCQGSHRISGKAASTGAAESKNDFILTLREWIWSASPHSRLTPISELSSNSAGRLVPLFCRRRLRAFCSASASAFPAQPLAEDYTPRCTASFFKASQLLLCGFLAETSSMVGVGTCHSQCGGSSPTGGLYGTILKRFTYAV